MKNIVRPGYSSLTTLAYTLIALTLIILSPSRGQAQSQWTTNGNDINNTNPGNVGIGTATPASLLTLNSTDNNPFAAPSLGTARLTIQNSSLTNNTSSELSFRTLDAAGSGWTAVRLATIFTSHSTNAVSGEFAIMTRNAGVMSEVARFSAAGNVGIGVNSPAYRLHIAGNNTAAGGFPLIKLQNTQASGHSYWLYSGANNVAGDFGLYDETDGAYRLYVKGASGNVGIGTTSPNYKLDVNGNVNFQGGVTYFRQSTGLAGGEGAIFSTGGTINNESYFDMAVYRAGAYTSRFGVDNYGRVYLQPGIGNVGIGTSAPAYKLDVQNGQVNASGGLCIAGDCKTAWSQVGGGGGSQWTTSGSNIYFNTGHVGIGIVNPVFDSNVSKFLTVDAGSGAIGSFGVGGNITNTAGTVGQMAFINTNLGITEKRIATIVGHNDGALNSGAIDFWTANAGGFTAPRLSIRASGYVGIGATNPNQTLTVAGYNASGFGGVAQIIGGAGSGTAQNQLNITSTANAWGLILGQNNGGVAASSYHCAGCAHIVNYNNASLILGTNNIERMAVTGAGNVGVGTVSPSYKLDVQGGQVNASGGLCIAGDCKSSWSQVGGGAASQWTTSGSNIFYNSGNVGIGTSSPTSAKLVISGSAGAEGLDLSSADQYANLRVIRNSNSVFDKDLYLQYGAGAGSKIHFYSNNSESITLTAGNVGIGTASPTARLEVNGNTKVIGNLDATGNITGATIEAKYQDVAEWVPSTQKLYAGTVVVLDDSQSNHVLASTKSYDTRVAGVISPRPGITLGEGGEGKVLVATTGRVKVKVDATRSPIKVGDLLVTGDQEGVAIKSEPIDVGGVQIHRPGTIIGKALEPLKAGTGEILVLLSLQ